VIDYVAEKYGRDACADHHLRHLAAKAVVRDVAACSAWLRLRHRIASSFPRARITLDGALEKEPELKACTKRDEVRNLIELARSLEG